jgi:hypothetical protein
VARGASTVFEQKVEAKRKRFSDSIEPLKRNTFFVTNRKGKWLPCPIPFWSSLMLFRRSTVLGCHHQRTERHEIKPAKSSGIGEVSCAKQGIRSNQLDYLAAMVPVTVVK